MEKQALINFSITKGKYKQFVDSIVDLSAKKTSAVVCVANVHMFIEAKKNEGFLKIVNEADVVTPDGKPLTAALKLLYGIKQDRVAGMDLLPDLLKEMQQKKMPAYFYGGSQGLIDKASDYFKKEYPGLPIAGLYSPPFRQLDKAEEKAIAEKINQTAPAIVFVVLGCPKQEKWMASMKGSVHATMIGIGGALPVLLGIQKRAPRWMQDFSLEWLFRLFQEPRRLFARYAVTNSLFLWIVMKEFIRLKFLIPLKLTPAKKI